LLDFRELLADVSVERKKNLEKRKEEVIAMLYNAEIGIGQDNHHSDKSPLSLLQ
jgi:hypothetical protein